MELKLAFVVVFLLVAFLPILVSIKGEEFKNSELTFFMLLWGLSFVSLHIIINTI